MKEIKAITLQIKKLETERDNLVIKIEHCVSTIANRNQDEARINALREDKKRLEAEAFITGTRADIKEVDRKIADAEKASVKAISDGEAAATALAILTGQKTAAEDELNTLKKEHERMLVEIINVEVVLSKDAYDLALEVVGKHAAKLQALGNIANTLGAPRVSGGIKTFFVNAYRNGISTFKDFPQPPSWLHYFFVGSALNDHPMKVEIDSQATAMLDQFRAADIMNDATESLATQIADARLQRESHAAQPANNTTDIVTGNNPNSIKTQARVSTPKSIPTEMNVGAVLMDQEWSGTDRPVQS